MITTKTTQWKAQIQRNAKHKKTQNTKQSMAKQNTKQNMKNKTESTINKTKTDMCQQSPLILFSGPLTSSPKIKKNNKNNDDNSLKIES